MKMNSKKIIVSTLALVMGAALAGSISGTVAWYQYSTRVTVGMSGTSAGTSRSLQIASELSAPKASDNLTDAHWGYNVAPASKNAVAPTTVLFDDGIIVDFASHPVYQYFNEWNEAEEEDYFQYDLYLQNLDLKGDKRLASDVYLTGYELEAGADILEDALRIEIVPYTISAGEWVKGTPRLLSKKGGTTTIADYLNLNTERNDVMDHNGFFADDSDGVATKYKANTKVTKADGDDATGLYSDAACSVPAVNKYSKVAAGTEDGTDWYKDEAMSEAAPATLENGVTYWHAGVAAGTYYEKGADGTTTYHTKGYIWDDSAIGENFKLNLRFGVEAAE